MLLVPYLMGAALIGIGALFLLLWLADPAVTLHSFIISNTPYDEIEYWGMSKEDLEDRHVLFQKEDERIYVEAMLNRILSHD